MTTQANNLNKIFQKYWTAVITGEDGLGGIEVAKAQKPDLVLMDVDRKPEHLPNDSTCQSSQ